MTQADGALPIVVAVCADASLAQGVLDDARRKLEHKLDVLKTDYPHSPIAIAAAPGLEQVAAAAAAAVGASIVANECHAVCDLRIHTAPDPSGAPHATLERPRRPQWELTEAQHRAALENTDRFNQDRLRHQSTQPEAIEASARSLALPEDVKLEDAARRLRDVFAVADALALHYHVWLKRAFSTIFLLGFVATALFAGYHIRGNTDLSYWFALVFAVGLVVYGAAKKRRVHERFIQYRALAETTRVQFYWEACGLRESTRDHCVSYLPDELAWVHDALLSVTKASPGHADGGHVAQRQLLERWIAEQSGYFHRAVGPARRLYGRLNRWANVLLWAGPVGIVLLLLHDWPWVPSFASPRVSSKDLFEWISVLSLVLPAAGGVVKAYLAKNALAYQEKHYARMAKIYDRAQARLEHTTPEDLPHIALGLGREALQENVQWATVLLEAGIDPPSTPMTKHE